MRTRTDNLSSRREFVRTISLSMLGVGVVGCDNMDPCATGQVVTFLSGLAGVVAQQTGNRDLAQIAGYTTVAVGALTVIACYEATRRQQEAVLMRKTKLKAAAAKYNTNTVLVRVPPPEEVKERTYTREGANLVENKQRPKVSAHFVKFNAKTEVVGTRAFEMANPPSRSGEMVKGFSPTPVPCVL